MASPENPSGGTPEEQAAAETLLNMFAATAGADDIFGPGTNRDPGEIPEYKPQGNPPTEQS